MKQRRMYSVVAIFLMAFFLYNFNIIARQGGVKTARTAEVPTWDISSTIAPALTGAVVLSDIEELPAFYPVFTFIAKNEHYSHPASRFKQRYDFLNLLQHATDPTLFAIALRCNRFDVIDYLYLSRKHRQHTLTISLSNYPDRLYQKELAFSGQALDDSLLFPSVGRNGFCRVADTATLAKAISSRSPTAKSLSSLAADWWLRRDLTPSGQALLDAYLEEDWSTWQALPVPEGGHFFSDSIVLVRATAVPAGDSLALFLDFEARADISGEYKLFLHLRSPDGTQVNLDFQPPKPTSTWHKWDRVICTRLLPWTSGRTVFNLGFFHENNRLGNRWQGVVSFP